MLLIKIYELPDGVAELFAVTDIHPEDANFLKDYDVSAEQLSNGTKVLYSTIHIGEQATEDNEVIYIVPSHEPAYIAFNKLRKLVEEKINVNDTATMAAN